MGCCSMRNWTTGAEQLLHHSTAAKDGKYMYACTVPVQHDFSTSCERYSCGTEDTNEAHLVQLPICVDCGCAH